MEDRTAQRLEFFKEMVSSVNAMPVTELGPDFNLVASTLPNPETMLNYMGMTNDYTGPNLAEANIDPMDYAPMRPVVCSNALGMVWIAETEIRKGKAVRIVLLGPIFLDDWEIQNIEKELGKHQISVRLKHRVLDYIRETPVLPLNRFYEWGVMLHRCIYEETIMVSDFSFANVEQPRNREIYSQQRHGTLAIEEEILSIVEQGNMNYRKVLDKAISSGALVSIGGDDLFRHQKDTVIMFITLVSRAAIRGGLPSETAYSLCEKYVAKVESASNLETLTLINWEMYGDFVKRVHRRKSAMGQISPQIQKVCDAIAMHPEEKADIHRYASELGYTDYYFSTKFKQEVGMSIRAFAMQEKMKRAKTLLMETGLSVQEISAELGFGSQSYFGDLFRRETGMTPGEYRAGGNRI